MKWIYLLRTSWIGEEASAGQPVQTAYLRPTLINETGEKMVGNIVEVTVIALEYYYKDPTNMLDEEEARRIYFEELAHQDYYLLHREVTQEEHYRMAVTDVYLKKEGFTQEEFFDWIRSVFSIEGYPLEELKEGESEDFLDMHPIMRLFTDEGIKSRRNILEKNGGRKE